MVDGGADGADVDYAASVDAAASAALVVATVSDERSNARNPHVREHVSIPRCIATIHQCQGSSEQVQEVDEPWQCRVLRLLVASQVPSSRLQVASSAIVFS